MVRAYRGFAVIIIGLFVYLFILQLYAIWPFTIDDMYISLRYAKHWSSGAGLLWNLHQPPVEGYSNFSFVALGTLTLLLKGNPVFVLKVAGALGLFFTCYFLYLITRFWFEKGLSLLPSLGLLCYKGQIIWAISGLETAVYEALICGAVYFLFKGMGYRLAPQSMEKSEYTSFVFAGLLLALAGLTRPETSFFMGLYFLLLCWEGVNRGDSHYWRAMSWFAFTLIIFYAPYVIWRLYYFGYLFPNPIYCKGKVEGFNFVLDYSYLKLVWPFALLAILACIKAQDKRHYFLWLPSIAYLILLAGADPIVAFDNRFFLPAFALLLPLALQGIDTIIFWYWPKKDEVFRTLMIVSFSLVIFFFIPTMSLSEYRYFSRNPVQGEQLRQAVLDWLKSHVLAQDNVVLGDSGMIPYYSDLNFIDSYCLNNLSMAHSLAKNRYEHFCQTILLEQPDIFILTSLIHQKKIIYTPSDTCLKVQLDKQKNYNLIQIFTSNDENSSYRYELYRKSLSTNF